MQTLTKKKLFAIVFLNLLHFIYTLNNIWKLKINVDKPKFCQKKKKIRNQKYLENCC